MEMKMKQFQNKRPFDLFRAVSLAVALALAVVPLVLMGTTVSFLTSTKYFDGSSTDYTLDSSIQFAVVRQGAMLTMGASGGSISLVKGYWGISVGGSAGGGGKGGAGGYVVGMINLTNATTTLYSYAPNGGNSSNCGLGKNGYPGGNACVVSTAASGGGTIYAVAAGGGGTSDPNGNAAGGAGGIINNSGGGSVGGGNGSTSSSGTNNGNGSGGGNFGGGNGGNCGVYEGGGGGAGYPGGGGGKSSSGGNGGTSYLNGSAIPAASGTFNRQATLTTGGSAYGSGRVVEFIYLGEPTPPPATSW